MSRFLSGCLGVLLLSASPALAQIHAELVSGGFDRPICLVADPTQPGVLFVAQQGGRIRVLQDGHLVGDFLDLRTIVSPADVGGLLGMALAPDYAVSGRFFLNYTNLSGNSVIARFTRSIDDPLTADPASEFDLVWPDGNPFIVQPVGDHNGGDLQFGPDGYLYVALGDGGGDGDPFNLAQDPTTLLGKMLRLDVSVADDDPIGYVVPGDNPFIANNPNDGTPWPFAEVWSIGFRNPWRYTFDDPARGGTGALIIADVGQDSWEEIDYEPAGRGGRNYGWPLREGANDYDPTRPQFPGFLTDPIFNYDHSTGHCIAGGFVYRGTALGDAYYGRYFFGDFVFSRIWSLGLIVDPETGEATAGDLIEHTADFGQLAAGPVSFGTDLNGEPYVLDYFHGRVSRILPGPNPCPTDNCVIALVPSDFNNDGHPDLVFHDYQTGANVVWLMDGGTVSSVIALPSVLDPAWQLSATGDVNGDGWPDLIWRNTQTGANVAWLMTGTSVFGVVGLPSVPDLAWQLVAAADMDRDGTADLIWRNTQTGANVTWYMRNAAVSSSTNLPTVPDRAWQLAAAGDMDGDGFPDLIWRNRQTGENVVWFMNNATLVSQMSLPTITDRTWQLVAAVDVNGDGLADLSWHNTATGANVVWFLSGAEIVGTLDLPPSTSLTMSVPGAPPPPVLSDFDGDGWSDLVWRNDTTGQNQVWFMNGANLVSTANLPGLADTNWQIVATTDLDGDGHPDLIWRNRSTGANQVWYLSGTTVLSMAALPTVSDLNWQLKGAADFDGDGHPDLLWRNVATGANVVWYMANPAAPVVVALPSVEDLTWQLVGAVDFDGDGSPDLLWRNTASGADVVWYMNNITVVGAAALPTVSDLSWRLVGAFDVNRDGFPDLIWRNLTTGVDLVWYMNNTTFVSEVALPTIADTHWRIVR